MDSMDRLAHGKHLAARMAWLGLLAGLVACGGGSGDGTPVAAGPSPAPTLPSAGGPAPAPSPAPGPGVPAASLPKAFAAVLLDPSGQAGPRGLNASGQVAYVGTAASGPRARFYDGSTTREITPDPAQAIAVNAAGQVAGQLVQADGGTRAFLWDPATDALRLIDTQPGISTAVEGLNDAGQVAGTLTRRGLPDAFRWPQGAGPEVLQPLPAANGALPLASALFINGSGTVAGISAVDIARVRAALWQPGAAVRDLGALGGEESRPTALNDAGQVAGHADTAAGTRHAFLWSAATGMQDLGTLGGPNSAATAINETGVVAGTSDSDAGPRAFRSQAGSMVSLGDLGGASSAATAINAAGHVGGTAQNADGAQRAFLWSPEDGMVDLNARLAGSGGPVLQSVIALADDGTVLASSTGGLVLLRPQAP